MIEDLDNLYETLSFMGKKKKANTILLLFDFF